MPSSQFATPQEPAVHNRPELAWNATWKPDDAKPAMLGLVSAIMPRRQSTIPAVPTVHKLPLLAWNAT